MDLDKHKHKKNNDEYILLDLDNVLVGRQKKFLKACQIIIKQLKRFLSKHDLLNGLNIMSRLSACVYKLYLV